MAARKLGPAARLAKSLKVADAEQKYEERKRLERTQAREQARQQDGRR